MKERPILFSGPMVRAILDGRKTQTRRVVKLPHMNSLGEWEPTTIGGENGGRTAAGETVPLQGGIWHTRTGDCLMCPHGQPGDRLWVRETWQHSNHPFGPYESDCVVFYRADYLNDPLGPDLERSADGIRREWRPSIHMPRGAGRITLEITGVRVERLQSISEADAIAEGAVYTDFGIEPPKGSLSLDGGRTFHPIVRGTQRNGWHMGDATSHERCMGSAKYAFANLINRLHGGENWNLKGPGLWEANPLVWAIEFRRIER
ncbi:hypothetical protein [Burkholderia pyrrocinia]|uniref:hypothetical protein n=1 Tax=Burkholderia pyrrocinia TaxID=60550 RepID=UPI00158E3A75|nr:hypothetical protein [Burkholderia pyrrocinia]